MLDKDENILTDRGMESTRCLAVQIFEQKKAKAETTFYHLYEQSQIRQGSCDHAYSKLNHLWLIRVKNKLQA